MWFPRLGPERALRGKPHDGPFALSRRQGNSDNLTGLNAAAEAAGLYPGMTLAEARAFCAGLQVQEADPAADRRLLLALQRWALRYCPRVGPDGEDGLLLDLTGAAHLLGGEARVRTDMQARARRMGLSLQTGIADSRGAAWAMAHFAPGIAAPGHSATALAALPVEALQIGPDLAVPLQRLGLRRIGDLTTAARAPLARRFGQELLDRLDRALGQLPDPIAPAPEAPHHAVRLTLPDPIGLVADVMAGLDRLLQRLCDRLQAQRAGARVLVLSLRRVDRGSLHLPLRLAAPMRDPARILPLFARGVEGIDAGFGIDQLRLEATLVEPLAAMQIGSGAAVTDRLDGLITRIGSRIGLENILRFQPVASHIPEKGFVLRPTTEARAEAGTIARWPARPGRPLTLFAPESIRASGPTPPERFHWRRMAFTTGRATGPERIAPEWWAEESPAPLPPPARGLRDYWRVETRQGRRLWMFHTPQDPGWFVQGEFL